MGTASLIYIFISTCLAFTVKGLVGFGDPLIFTPLLSVYLPNAAITPTFAPVSPFLNVGLVWKNRKFFNLKIVLPIVAFNLMGIIPGTLLLKFGSLNGVYENIEDAAIKTGVKKVIHKNDFFTTRFRYSREIIRPILLIFLLQNSIQKTITKIQ